MINLDELSEKIIKYRVKNNLTQQECAKEFGISSTTICYIENKSKTIRYQTLIKVEMILEEKMKNKE